MTRDEMMRLQPADGWGDGRDGFLFCRFSAVIDRLRRLRAEVVWEDDGDSLPANQPPTLYTNPQLELEYYRPDQVVGFGDLTAFEGGPERCLILSITDDLAREILAVTPTDLLRRYADWFASLDQIAHSDGSNARLVTGRDLTRVH